MLKFKLMLIVALGLFMFGSVPAIADGYGPHRGGHPNHGNYYHSYHGGYGYRVYAPPVYRPRVIYPAPYVVAPPIYAAPVCPGYGYYAAPGGSFYIQGRNFGFGVGF